MTTKIYLLAGLIVLPLTALVVISAVLMHTNNDKLEAQRALAHLEAQCKEYHEVHTYLSILNMYSVSHKFLRVNTTDMFQSEIDTFNHQMIRGYTTQVDCLYTKLIDSTYKISNNH